MTHRITLEESWAIREEEGLVPYGRNAVYAHPRTVDTLLVQAGHSDQAFARVLDRIIGTTEVAADVAIARLDGMVDEFNQRQKERLQDFYDPYGRLFRSVRSLVVEGGRYRSLEAQRELYERWSARTNPRGIAFPGAESHHRRGPSLAIDMGESAFDVAGHHLSDLGYSTQVLDDTPWHFEYTGPGPRKRKPWWRRTWHRFADFFRSTAW